MTQPANTLTIRFSPVDPPNTYRLDLAGPRVGETSGAFTPPFDSATWPAIWCGLQPGAELDAADQKTLAPLGGRARLPETAGRALAGALLADAPLASAFAAALASAVAERRPLPVELRFAGGTDAVAALPWELLHHDGRFLVADTSIALTRYPEAARPPTEALAELPLRVLLALAQPVDAPPILSHVARAELLHGLRSLDEAGAVIVDLLRPPTFQALVEAVRTGGHHLLVFYGHGAPDGLLLEDEYGGGTSVKAGELGAALRNTEVRLALLAAGQSAQPGPSIWSAVAPALVQAGVPLAIGLQTGLSVDAALAFIRQFALSLAAGKPVVDAVADGRLPLIRAGGGAAWFAPALYGRPRGDTRLFDPAQALPQETAALRAEMHEARVEIARLEQIVGRAGVLTAPQEIAALRAARQRFADARAALARRTPGGYSAATSPLYGVPANPIFVGRSAELQRVSRALRGTQPAVIWGAGGIGKTALAAEVARRQSWRFPGGVLWLDCRGGPAWDTLLDRMGSFCGLDMQLVEPDKKEATVRLALAGLEDGCLLVWDNAEDVWGSQPARDFVAQLPVSCRALITTREDPEQPMWTVVELAPLPDLAMAELFQRLAGATGVKEAGPADLAAIPLILGWLQGHPLALELVVPLAKRRGLARVWQDLQKRPLKGVEAALEASYQRLSELQKRLFARLSVWSIPFDWPAAEALMPKTRGVDDALDSLVQRALIGFDGARYSYHPLVQQVAYEKLRAFEEPRRVHRLAAMWLRGKLDDDKGAPEEALEEVDQWERAEEWGLFALSAITLVGSLAPRGYWTEIQSRLERSKRILATHPETIVGLQEAVLGALGSLANTRAAWSDAIAFWEEQANLYRSKGNELGLARALGDLGLAYANAGNWSRALALYEESLRGKQRLGDTLGMSMTFNNLGLLYNDLSEWDKAIEYFHKDLEIIEPLGHHPGMSETYNNLGMAYTGKGDWGLAIEFHNKALSISRQLRHVHDTALALNNLANVHSLKGDWDLATELYDQSLALKRELGDRHGMAMTCLGLGNVFREKGELERAAELLQDAVSTFEKTGDPLNLRRALLSLGTVEAERGAWNGAVPYYERALQISKGMEDLAGQAEAYMELGIAYLRLGDMDESTAALEQALEFHERLQDKLGMARSYLNIGLLRAAQGNLYQAIEYAKRSLALSQQLGDRHGIALVLAHLGEVYSAQGLLEQAFDCHLECLRIRQDMNDSRGVAHAYMQIASIAAKRGNREEAMAYYEQSRQILESVGDVHGMAEVISPGIVHDVRGDGNQATASDDQALRSFEPAGDAQRIAQTMVNQGMEYSSIGQPDMAIVCYQQALQMFESIGDLQGIGQSSHDLGHLYWVKGDVDQAAQYTADAYLIFVQIGASSEVQQAVQQLVNIMGSVEAAEVFMGSLGEGAIGPTVTMQSQEEQSIALEQLLDYVVQARHGDHALGQQIFDLTRDLASDPAQSAEMRALGRVLQSVLAGERAPDLSELPPELAGAVQEILARLQPPT